MASSAGIVKIERDVKVYFDGLSTQLSNSYDISGFSEERISIYDKFGE